MRVIAASLVVAAALAGVHVPAVLAASESPSPRVRIELLSERQSIVAGETFWIGHRQQIAPGTQGYVLAKEADDFTRTRNASPTAVLLDPTGVVGKMYGATNTPHMYVVDKSGALVYAGAIDDKPTTRRSDVKAARSYVREALQAVAAGQPVKTPVTGAYGCTVKCA